MFCTVINNVVQLVRIQFLVQWKHPPVTLTFIINSSKCVVSFLIDTQTLQIVGTITIERKKKRTNVLKPKEWLYFYDSEVWIAKDVCGKIISSLWEFPFQDGLLGTVLYKIGKLQITWAANFKMETFNKQRSWLTVAKSLEYVHMCV